MDNNAAILNYKKAPFYFSSYLKSNVKWIKFNIIIQGLPARHANVIKKHHEVVKETTFLHKAEAGIDKDQATKDAIALLDKEYEIFNEPSMPGVKVLTRYDTWDEDRTIEDWIEYCQQRPG